MRANKILPPFLVTLLLISSISLAIAIAAHPRLSKGAVNKISNAC